MRIAAILSCVAAWCALEWSQVRLLAQNAKELTPNVIIRKAIEAHGGKAHLVGLTSYYARGKGSLFLLPPHETESYAFTAEYWFQDPDKTKHVFDFKVDGKTSRVIRVWDGKRGWQKKDGRTEEFNIDEVADFRRSIYKNKLRRLYPLLEEASSFVLGTVAEAVVLDRPAFGIKVGSKGQKDVNLYFDKDNGLLVKIVSENTGPNGQPVMFEEIFTAYKLFSGIRYPFKRLQLIGRKKYIEDEIVELRILPGIPREQFVRP
jgi:hypothetical protein